MDGGGGQGITDGDGVWVGLRLQRVSMVVVSGSGTETSGQCLSAEPRKVVWVPDPAPDQ